MAVMPVPVSLSSPRVLLLVLFSIFFIAGTMYLITQESHEQLSPTPLSPSLSFSSPLPSTPLPFRTDLGEDRLPIYTTNSLSQQYFNQGFRYLLAFNFKLAYQNFQQAEAFDDKCILCYWGQAFSLGQNLNAPMTAEAHRKAVGALEKGTIKIKEIQDIFELGKKRLFERDRALLFSLKERYTSSWEEYQTIGKKTLNFRYAQKMEQLTAFYPSDEAVMYFTADALMNTSPWDYYKEDGITLIPAASRAKELIYKILKENEFHPGAIHLLIHITEASKHPEEALPYAKKLAPLIEGSSHLQHMPSHTFIRVGSYEESAEANDAAVFSASDEVYPMHNMQFLLYSYRMMGRRNDAYKIADKLEEKAKQSLDIRESGFSTQRFVVEKILTLVMFEDWFSLLALPPPPPGYSYWKAIWLFGRAMALTSQKPSKLSNAQMEEKKTIISTFLEAAQECVDDPSLDPLPTKQLMELYTMVLEGKKLMINEQEGKAVEKMERGLEIESALPYDEPPIFVQPFSHYLLPSLLLSSQNERASKVIQESLKTAPHDGWALIGLVKACENLSNSSCASEAKKDLNNHWEHSEVTLDPRFRVRRIARSYFDGFDVMMFVIVCVALGIVLCWFQTIVGRNTSPLRLSTKIEV